MLCKSFPFNMNSYLGDSLKEANEEATRKKNRKKHKDLPTLGNKYSVAVARSKSKAIPAARYVK